MTRLINETDTVVLIPAYSVLGVPNAILPTGLVPMDALTATAINYYSVVTNLAHANAGAGGNISAALLADGFELGLTDSEEDDEKTLVDAGNSVDLTEKNFDADFTGFRDIAPAANDSVYNLYRSLTFAPDVEYIIVHRVGYDSTTPFAALHEIDAYYAATDVQLAIHRDGEYQKTQSVFIPKNETKISYEISA